MRTPLAPNLIYRICAAPGHKQQKDGYSIFRCIRLIDTLKAVGLRAEIGIAHRTLNARTPRPNSQSSSPATQTHLP